MCSVLIANGFISNPYDPCVYNKTSDDGHQVTVCFHVDDLLITSKIAAGMKALEEYLSEMFSEVTFVRGDNNSNLSMSINRLEQFWEIDMKNYIHKCLEGKVFPSNVR